MAKFRTSRAVELRFRDFHDVTVPKGVPVTPVTCGHGPEYTVSPEHVETTSQRGRNTIWAHDTKYFYIFVPAGAVEAVEG